MAVSQVPKAFEQGLFEFIASPRLAAAAPLRVRHLFNL
jgi:hypothetical protein